MIDVVLATHNGEKYLPAQLNSIAAQVGVDWRIIASDDGSTDQTKAQLERFSAKNNQKLLLRQGPKQGLGTNFLTALRKVRDTAQWAAFSDQDDVWLPTKLYRAIEMIYPHTGPALYCSPQLICDHNLSPFSRTPYPTKPPTFGNAIVQNIAAGNTIVLNRAAIDIINATDHAGIHFHDWWAYQVITAVGGKITYDTSSKIFYRQHRTNQIGAACGLKGKLKRLLRLMSHNQAKVIADHVAALNNNRYLFTPLARKHLFAWQAVHNLPATKQRYALKNAGIFRQSKSGQLAFEMAMMAGLFAPQVNVRETPLATYKVASINS